MSDIRRIVSKEWIPFTIDIAFFFITPSELGLSARIIISRFVDKFSTSWGDMVSKRINSLQMNEGYYPQDDEEKQIVDSLIQDQISRTFHPDKKYIRLPQPQNRPHT